MPDLAKLKIAIVHYFLVHRRGGERVLEVLAQIFHNADIFTLVLDRNSLGPALKDRIITSSFLQRLPGAISNHQRYMALFPLAVEQFRLDKYDLVISHEAGPAKGVLTKPDTCHVSYVHSPMRYIWDMYHDYKSHSPGGAFGRALYASISHYLRLWDHACASRVDYFAASSRNSARRIEKHYRRTAEIIHPPVDTSQFCVSVDHEDFYLIVSPLVAYKRVDLAIKACNELNRKLVIIGDGDQNRALRKIAGPTVSFLGNQSDEVVREHYRRCRAFLFPGEEDIGLTPIEAQASGRPVIAYGRGGALETVNGLWCNESFDPEATGVFFAEQTTLDLVNALHYFESLEDRFLMSAIRARSEMFDVERFKAKMMDFICRSVSAHSSSNSGTSETSALGDALIEDPHPVNANHGSVPKFW